MARQTQDRRLKEIGLEGFALIDEIYGPAKRPPPAVMKGNQFPFDYPKGKPVPLPKVIDSNEAAVMKGNQFPFDYPRGKPVPLPKVIDSKEAAKIHRRKVYLDYRIVEYEVFY